MQKSVVISEEKKKEIERYVSIDFLRGASIFGMLCLHFVLKILNVDYYTDQISDIALINIIALITLPFIGGLAGLFLMTSAVGTGISMQRNYDKGHSIQSVRNKQVMIGILVIFFAMLTEGVIGYNGIIGEILRKLHDPSAIDWYLPAYRIFHFETIHTIGYAILFNGIIHYFLVKRYHFRDEVDKIIKAYWKLSIVVLVLTPIVWELTEIILPGYPDFVELDTPSKFRYMPVIGQTTWSEIIIIFLINPFSAPLEPILPYLATSFMGTIIGLQLSKPTETFDRTFVQRYFKYGIRFFWIGFIGLVVLLAMQPSIDDILNQWRKVSWHRSYTSENGMPGGWLPQFLALNGLAFALVMLAIRLTEYRGNATTFAQKTTFIRRFGFIAFSVYAMQYIMYLVWYVIGLAFYQEVFIEKSVSSASNPMGEMYKLKWLEVWIIGVLTITIFHYLMKWWEKRGYVGSIEWAMSTLANSFTKVKRQASYSDNKQNQKWWEKGKLNVEEIFYGPVWKNFPVSDKNRLNEEKRLVKKLNRWGFFLFPFTIVAYNISKRLRIKHPDEGFDQEYKLSIIGLGFFITWLVLSLIFSLSTFGLSL